MQMREEREPLVDQPGVNQQTAAEHLPIIQAIIEI